MTDHRSGCGEGDWGEGEKREEKDCLFGDGEQLSALPMLCLGAQGLVVRKPSRRGGKMGC